MSFDWKDYLKLGEKLLKERELKEAALRSSISRAFYSVYHNLRFFLKKKGIDWDKKEVRQELKEEVKKFKCEDKEKYIGDHETMIEIFRGNIVKVIDEEKSKEIGNLLDEIRVRRASADYHDEFRYGDIANEANLILLTARMILDKIKDNA